MTDVDKPTVPEHLLSVAMLGADVSAEHSADTNRSMLARWSPAEATVVEQAKGVLMLRYGVGSFEALGALVRWAHDVDVTVFRIARTLTQGVCQGRTPADDQGRWLVRWLEQRLREDLPDQTERERWAEEA